MTNVHWRSGAALAVAALATFTILIAGPVAAIAALALCAAAAVCFVSRRFPTIAAACWLLLLVLIPPWVSASVLGLRVAPAAALSILILIGRLGLPLPKFNKYDFIAIALGGALFAALIGGSPRYLTVQGVGEWLLCYAAARSLFSDPRARETAPLVIVGTTLAVLSVIQATTLLDASSIFSASFGTETGSEWRALQYRAGTVRSEVTLGHSIALAGVLSLCLPYVLKVKHVIVRLALGLLVLVGIVATQSRAGLVVVGLICVLFVITTRKTSPTAKVLLLIPPVGVLFFALPGLIQNFVLGGGDSSSEVTQGTEYRFNLLNAFGQVNLFGLGDDASLALDGVSYTWGSFRSIDNAFLYLGLYLGAVAAVLFLLPTILAAFDGWKYGWTVAQVAVVAQIPLLLTVAPITQYQSVYWFVIGIAACRDIERPTTAAPIDPYFPRSEYEFRPPAARR
jgi:hypothetical protein